MYSARHNLILGFHGCDIETRNKIINSNKFIMTKKDNAYDWLGNGYYFWENNYERALNFAEEVRDHPDTFKTKIKTPAVIGAVIDLGVCFDLLDNQNIATLKEYYSIFIDSYKKIGKKLPINAPGGSDIDLLLRDLDCAMIESTIKFIEETKPQIKYDSVRGVFWEGKEIYPGAGFKEKNHIQICIRNPNCVKGFFNPLKETPNFNIP